MNTPQKSGTSEDVGRRRRTNAPREKRGGISLPVHLWQAIDTIVTLQTDSYAAMGGETKASVSDEVEIAVEAHVRDFIKTHGPLPVTNKDRADYVARLAKHTATELQAELNEE